MYFRIAIYLWRLLVVSLPQSEWGNYQRLTGRAGVKYTRILVFRQPQYVFSTMKTSLQGRDRIFLIVNRTCRTS